MQTRWICLPIAPIALIGLAGCAVYPSRIHHGHATVHRPAPVYVHPTPVVVHPNAHPRHGHAHDRDGDGRVNRRDPDRDGDGVANRYDRYPGNWRRR